MAFAPSILSARTAERLDRILSTRVIEVQSPQAHGVRQVTIVEVIGPVGVNVWSPCKVLVINAEGRRELHSAECQFSDPDNTVYAPGQALWAMRCGSNPYGDPYGIKPRYLVTGRPALMHRWGTGSFNSTFLFNIVAHTAGSLIPWNGGVIVESSVKVPRAGLYEVDARFTAILQSVIPAGIVPVFDYNWRAFCVLEQVNDDGTAFGSGDFLTEFARGQGVISTTFDTAGAGGGGLRAADGSQFNITTTTVLQSIMRDCISGGSFNLRTHVFLPANRTTIRLRVFCSGTFSETALHLYGVICSGRGSMHVVSAARSLVLQPALPPPDPYSPPPPPAATYSIAGMLHDPDLYQSTHVSATMNLSGPETRSITTGSALANPFSFTILPAGTYTLTCSNATAVPASRTITIGPNATGQDFEIPTTKGQINCHVWIDADQDGSNSSEDAPGRSVTIAGPVTQTASTNVAGYATFPGIPSGTYTVSVAITSPETCPSNGGSVFVNPQGVSSVDRRIDVPPIPKFYIAGNVLNSSGVSQGGYTVSCNGSSVLTIAGQKWSFGDLIEGTYTVSVVGVGSATVTLGPSVNPLNFTV